jgi:predicted CxxxxCH...CXXCH cytochrome family protein
MISRFALFLLLLIPLVLTGCADENSTAPPDNQAHPASWYTAHRPAASASLEYADCKSCHGADLLGSGSAPSCFSASFDGRSCHAGGPVPHPMDGTFLSGTAHGPEAKADLTFCQTCHSDNPTGGPGSNPSFNVGIDSQGGTGCEACHPTNAAHPAVWAGPTADAFHYSAGNIQAACTLCHGTALDGGGVAGAISCLDCHAAPFDGTLDCAACHGTPPTGITNHVNASNISSHGVCTVCHGMKESTAGGTFSAVTNYALFNKTTDVPGDHWDGNINMNSDAGYNENDFGCDTASCHGNDTAHQLSDSGLTVALSAYGGGAGGGAPHSLDADWLLPAGHVASAATSCLGCHVADGSGIAQSCLNCHTNGDPLTVLACESCHSEPPNTTSTALVDRPDRAGNHGVHTTLTTDTGTCAACHSGAGTNTANHFDDTEPADVSFLATYNATSAAGYNATTDTCSNVSCHGGVTTPNWNTGAIDVYGGGTAGCQQCHKSGGESNAYASGEHNLHVGFGCTTCHDTTVLQSGVAGNSHFSGLKTSTFELDPQQTINASVNYTGSSCNPACHGSENW